MCDAPALTVSVTDRASISPSASVACAPIAYAYTAFPYDNSLDGGLLHFNREPSPRTPVVAPDLSRFCSVCGLGDHQADTCPSGGHLSSCAIPAALRMPATNPGLRLDHAGKRAEHKVVIEASPCDTTDQAPAHLHYVQRYPPRAILCGPPCVSRSTRNGGYRAGLHRLPLAP